MFYLVFLVTFSASLLYAFTRPKTYEAEAQAAHYHFSALFKNSNIILPETIYDHVAERIAYGKFQNSESPYSGSILNDRHALTQILKRDSVQVFIPEKRMIAFRFRHISPKWAATIANIFVDECIAQDARIRIDKAMAQVEERQSVIALHQTEIQKLTEELALLTDPVSKDSSLSINPHEQREKQLQESIRLHQLQHDKLLTELRDFVNHGSLDTGSRIIDPATPPDPKDYISPNILQYIGLGFTAALVLGLGASCCLRKS